MFFLNESICMVIFLFGFPEVPSQAVGKAFKCSYCSRSYKQQNTLEEHLERCHSYLKSLGRQAAVITQTAPGNDLAGAGFFFFSSPASLLSGSLMGLSFAGEENMDGLKKPSEKIQLVDRLAISVTKRKRSTPKKFLGGFVFVFKGSVS